MGVAALYIVNRCCRDVPDIRRLWVGPDEILERLGEGWSAGAAGAEK